MSIVGNRPLPLYEAELLTSDEHIDRLWDQPDLPDCGKVEKEVKRVNSPQKNASNWISNMQKTSLSDWT